MMILILLIILAAVLMVIRKQQEAKAQAHYWTQLNEFETQRKKQILKTAIKMQQRENCRSKTDNNWKQAS